MKEAGISRARRIVSSQRGWIRSSEEKKNQKSTTENGKAGINFTFFKKKKGAAIGSTLDFQRHNCVAGFL